MGHCDTRLIDRLHLNFCNHIFNLKSSTPNLMVYGELGRNPLIINVKVRMISIWGKLLNRQNSKMSPKLFYICMCYEIIKIHGVNLYKAF